MRFLNRLFVLLSTVSFVLSSCQSEINQEAHSINSTISKTSPLTTYIQRIALLDTSNDDSVDGTDCYTIKFPYTITLNDKEIALNSVIDYQLVELNKNTFTIDDDIVHLHFPLTVVFSDYSEKIVSSQEDYENLKKACLAKSQDLLKIKCVKINYPIVINSYNGSNQIASSSTITDDSNLFSFINKLPESQFIAIVYPINVSETNGNAILIADNFQFEDEIKKVLDNCVTNTNTLDFIQVLTKDSWKISYYFHEAEKTNVYANYVFVFKSDNSLVVTSSGVARQGTWFTKLDDGKRKFEMKFSNGNEILNKLDEKWETLEFNQTNIRFRKTNDKITETDYLYFSKLN